MDGGPARHALEVNFALNAIGEAVQLYSVNPDDGHSLLRDLAGRSDYPALPPQTLSRGGLDFLRLLLTIHRAKRLIVHGYYLWWVPIAVAVATASGVPVIVMPHGSLTAYDRKKSRLRKEIFKLAGAGWLIDKSAQFFVASEIEKSELPTSIPRSRVLVVGAGAEDTGPPPRLHRSAHSPVRLLTLSRIAVKKRIDLSIEAVHELSKRGFEARLTIAGAGPQALMDDLASTAKRLRIENMVDFRGEVNSAEKSTLFEEADIFLLPSDDENFGLAYAEACMQALPAVVSDSVGAASNMPADAGTRLNRPDARAIASAVQKIVETYPFARAAMRSFAEAEFSWPSVAERWRAGMSMQDSNRG